MSARTRGRHAEPGAATAAFFERLADRGYESPLERASGTIRVDLVDGSRTEHWLVSIDRGHVAVSRDGADADAMLRTDPATFDDIVTGRSNVVAATLRGVVEVEGDPELIVVLRRILPGPAPSGRRRSRKAGAS